MRVQMYAWVSGIKNLPSWFKTGEEADISTDQILELYATGNNIALMHAEDETLLVVDTKRFTQR